MIIPTISKNYLINKLKRKYNDESLLTQNPPDNDNLPKLWIHIPYLG